MAKQVKFTVKLNIDGKEHIVKVAKDAKQLELQSLVSFRQKRTNFADH